MSRYVEPTKLFKKLTTNLYNLNQLEYAVLAKECVLIKNAAVLVNVLHLPYF
jgi:hypothetical protein